MEVSAIDLETYDLVATQIIYYKLFPYIMQDFVTRTDLQLALSTGNILTQVQVAIPAGTGTGILTKAIYDGGTAGPGAIALKAGYKAAEEAGGATIEGLKSGISKIAGF